MARLKAPTSVGGVDIDPTGAVLGQILSFNGTAFVPADPSSGSSTFLGYDLSTVITAPPNDGQIRMDNVDQSAVTTLWIDYKTSGSTDVRNIIRNFGAGSEIIIQDKNDAAAWVKYLVNSAIADDVNGYMTYDVTMLSEGAEVPNGASLAYFTSPGGGGGGGAFLPLSGGTMTGDLNLNEDPDEAMAAATKQYVDAQIAALQASRDFALLGSVTSDGVTGTMTISSLPQTHRDLMILVHGSHPGSTQQQRIVTLRLNADSGNNYRFVSVVSDDNGNPTRASIIGTNGIQLGGFGDDTDLSQSVVHIPDYSASRNKAVSFNGGSTFGNSAGQSRHTTGWGAHIDANPLTQVTVVMSVEPWRSGSNMRIYGIGKL